MYCSIEQNFTKPKLLQFKKELKKSCIFLMFFAGRKRCNTWSGLLEEPSVGKKNEMVSIVIVTLLFFVH